jgi:hypothetical protein
MGGLHLTHDDRTFHSTVTVRTVNQCQHVHNFVIMHTSSSILFVSHVKQMVRFFFLFPSFYLLFF